MCPIFVAQSHSPIFSAPESKYRKFAASTGVCSSGVAAELSHSSCVHSFELQSHIPAHIRYSFSGVFEPKPRGHSILQDPPGPSSTCPHFKMAAQRPVACRLMSEYHIIKTCSDLREFRLCVPSTIFEELQPPSLISETSGNVHSCNVFERSPTLPGSQLNLVSTSTHLLR